MQSMFQCRNDIKGGASWQNPAVDHMMRNALSTSTRSYVCLVTPEYQAVYHRHFNSVELSMHSAFLSKFASFVPGNRHGLSESSHMERRHRLRELEQAEGGNSNIMQPTPQNFPLRSQISALSLVERAAGESRSRVEAQDHAALFRLPKELLLIIYKEVIGDRVLHILRRKGPKLGHAVCRFSQENASCSQCRGMKMPTGLYQSSGTGSGDLIPLLQCCRKM